MPYCTVHAYSHLQSRRFAYGITLAIDIPVQLSLNASLSPNKSSMPNFLRSGRPFFPPSKPIISSGATDSSPPSSTVDEGSQPTLFCTYRTSEFSWHTHLSLRISPIHQYAQWDASLSENHHQYITNDDETTPPSFSGCTDDILCNIRIVVAPSEINA